MKHRYNSESWLTTFNESLPARGTGTGRDSTGSGGQDRLQHCVAYRWERGLCYWLPIRHNFLQNIGRRFLPYKVMNLFPSRVLGKCRVQPEPVGRSLTHRLCMWCNRHIGQYYTQFSDTHYMWCTNLGLHTYVVYDQNPFGMRLERKCSRANKIGFMFPRKKLKTDADIPIFKLERCNTQSSKHNVEIRNEIKSHFGNESQFTYPNHTLWKVIPEEEGTLDCVGGEEAGRCGQVDYTAEDSHALPK
ncbi:hypothetical protein EVAR_23118_1 [Eumeta japonica]|uniref:Uncharacterized protein n=1 Tax=Eumeta variegata TaxID=151549 RepID=A0A4C1VB87_EUMVA|nr:hypothetical protein EVAR_23118_1 [Eumeta japonica]